MRARTRIAVAIECAAWTQAVGGVAALCRRAAEAALDAAAKAGHSLKGASELSLVLGDDALSRRLNRTYRGQDRPTNVLSFEGGMPAASTARGAGDPPHLVGDVVVALETTRAEAAGQGKPLADHLSHLIIHGTLHLSGFDHESDADAAIMERLEIAILTGLGVPDPYAAERPAPKVPLAERETAHGR